MSRVPFHLHPDYGERVAWGFVLGGGRRFGIAPNLPRWAGYLIAEAARGIADAYRPEGVR